VEVSLPAAVGVAWPAAERKGASLRTFRCVDCPVEASEHPAPSSRGPVPVRCGVHKARRAARAEARRKSRLRVVGDGEVPSPPSVDPGPERQSKVAAAAVLQVLAALQVDLDGLATTHPAAQTLQLAAVKLATAIDDPVTGADGRVLAALVKELRATLGELTSREEADRDDLFGADSAGPVVVSTQG
jgi:hypothetical protein